LIITLEDNDKNNQKYNDDNIYEWQIRLADGEQNPIGNNINLPDDLINECRMSLSFFKDRRMKGRREAS